MSFDSLTFSSIAKVYRTAGETRRSGAVGFTHPTRYRRFTAVVLDASARTAPAAAAPDGARLPMLPGPIGHRCRARNCPRALHAAGDGRDCRRLLRRSPVRD